MGTREIRITGNGSLCVFSLYGENARELGTGTKNEK
jgi:hypothetical protein